MIGPRCWIFSFFMVVCFAIYGQTPNSHDLQYTALPQSWDEGIPLGNGMMGALVWQKDSFLRISLDRADLWDLRPVKEFSLPQFRFSWVREQLEKNRYDSVQKLFDEPYERDPGPSKIPAGALEIPIGQMGAINSVHLFLKEALCEIKWLSGARLLVFVDARRHQGRFRLEHPGNSFRMRLIIPGFAPAGKTGTSNSVDGQSLARLGYPPAQADTANPGYQYFWQQGYGDFQFAVFADWKKEPGNMVDGTWSIGTSNQDIIQAPARETMQEDAHLVDFDSAFREHCRWWMSFWQKSSIRLPDTLLENQWYREIYKFGSASRKGGLPITLQAVWTADNGNLPPWKGDFHNDLNTQLSYWPGYASNHLEESQVFPDWIWSNRRNAENYTKTYFGCPGLNFPGVSTLTGEPMGGWIQYALSPTVSCWLAQNFYLQWEYSKDTGFLRDKAYPFIRGTARFIEAVSEKHGKFRQLPLSSSPEFFDNSPDAWFHQTTNYDLALIRWMYQAASEVAKDMHLPREARHWRQCLSEWPELALSDSNRLLIAPGFPCKTSHRHFSHLMAIFPLGLLDWHAGKRDQGVILGSISDLLLQGHDYWCGYSYAWLGNLQARARNGEGACDALRTFAGCFCLPNSFHVNGDQSGTGKSKFTYRPFTLEGNFAFASGIQEMLLQSDHDRIVVFPAIPDNWENVSFQDLRARGAFLVSATMTGGELRELKIISERGGDLKLENPFGKKGVKVKGGRKFRNDRHGMLTIPTIPAQVLFLEPAGK